MTTLLVSLALVVTAPAPKEGPKREPASLVGEWVPVAAVQGEMNETIPPGARLVVTADSKFIFREGMEDSPEVMTYTSNPKADPPRLDVRGAGMKAETYLGIYKIEGDTLTICLAEKGGRPTEFASPAGSKNILLTLTRAKKD